MSVQFILLTITLIALIGAIGEKESESRQWAMVAICCVGMLSLVLTMLII